MVMLCTVVQCSAKYIVTFGFCVGSVTELSMETTVPEADGGVATKRQRSVRL